MYSQFLENLRTTSRIKVHLKIHVHFKSTYIHLLKILMVPIIIIKWQATENIFFTIIH